MRTEDIEEMRRLPLSVGVDRRWGDAMLEPAFLQRTPPEIVLVHEGEPAHFLHTVIEGQVGVSSVYGNHEATIAVLGPGHSFIVAAIVLDRLYLEIAGSLRWSRVLLLPAEAVGAAFAEDAAFVDPPSPKPFQVR